MIGLGNYCLPLNTHVYSSKVPCCQAHRESMPFYEARQARQACHFMKHGKHAIL